MDRFSLLSDELLIKILSFVPTKDAVSTSVLSKRWQYLWMWLPKLQYGKGCYSSSECEMLQCFLNRNIPLHRAPVIESFHLLLSSLHHFTPNRIKSWIETTISLCVREQEVHYFSSTAKPDTLPGNIFTCKSLVILKFYGDILLDVPRMIFLPSLQSFHLTYMRYFCEESLRRLLSNSPMLEDLLVNLEENKVMAHENEVVGELTVVSQSLQRLSLSIPPYCYDIDGIVVKTPFLKYFKLMDCKKNQYVLIENIANLIEAYLEVENDDIESFIGSLVFVKHLVICTTFTYVEGMVFSQLQHLKICKGYNHPSDLLLRLLEASRNLQLLHIEDDPFTDEVFYWNQPSTTPECLLSSLQTLNWDGYTGTPEKRDFAVYVLKNASHLRTATIEYYEFEVPIIEMRKELELTSRASTTCQLCLFPTRPSRI